MTTPEHPEGTDRGRTAPVWPCGQRALALRRAAEQGSEEGVEVRPEDVGLPVALVQRFDEACRGDIESLPQRLLDACGGDGHLCIALQLLKTLSVARPGSPPGTFMMDWQTFSTFTLALLRRTPDVPLVWQSRPRRRRGRTTTVGSGRTARWGSGATGGRPPADPFGVSSSPGLRRNASKAAIP